MTDRPARSARALAVLDERLNQLDHQPARPAWNCQSCGGPWPCSPAKVRLAEAYAGDRTGLSVYMSALYAAALNELPTTSADWLYGAFIRWTRSLPRKSPAAPDGRRNKKEINRAVRTPQPV
ncbi:hypothetical protein [Micromonospora robiginosa]|uniref:Flavin reductase n=1 Tax=Micromonospora robiginosa TaxID=2749844 RepID=A0A7L6B817_9ACTN|nr:hypothetical protein [Micromonospora ferruginea]QLQ38018.1 hypothetical protein H1D33_03745 [Micromonospora ferruginea]